MTPQAERTAVSEIYALSCHGSYRWVRGAHLKIMKRTLNKILFLVLIVLSSCMGAGTHGSLENYQFGITKDSLQVVIDQVISSDSNIYRDTIPTLAGLNEKGDLVWDYSYRDRIEYETIYIETDDDKVEFVFRYYGDSEYWNKSPSSEIFICWAYDKNGNGGSEGQGNISSKTQSRLVGIFTKEFVEKIKKQVSTKPTRNAG